MKKNYTASFMKLWRIFLTIMFLTLCCGYWANAQSIDKLEQLANGPLKTALDAGYTCDGDDWVTGNVNAAKAHFACGMTIPYRMSISGLVSGNSYQVVIGYDTKKSGKHAIDFLTAFDRPTRHEEIFGHEPSTIDPLIGLLPAGTSYNDYPLPAPTANMYVDATGMWGPISGFNQTVTDGWSYFRIYNGATIGDGLIYQGTDPALTTASDYLVVNFTVNQGQSRVVLAWGGNIACSERWGEGMSAEAIPGSPYHMFVHDCTNLSGCGNKEVQLAASAIYPCNMTCTITPTHVDCFGWATGSATVTPENGAEPFTYLWSNGQKTQTITGLIAGTYSVTVTDSKGCTSYCETIIEEPPYVPINLNCGEDTNVDPCIATQDLTTAFNDWLADFTVSGGTQPLTIVYTVNGSTVASLDGVQAPDVCGGSVVVSIDVTDACELHASCQGTFTVPAPDAIVHNFPDDMTAGDCLSQDAIDEAFADWLDEATVSGGCDPNLDYGQPVAPDACGGEVTVYFEITDYCLDEPILGSATFTVPAPDAIVHNFPEDMTAGDCLSQDAINDAFDAWLDEATVS
ncbi:MAG TPA: hypothetical protein DCY35_09175, partial [Prolixibacteraceae bacterium]|nr:hypothetical protein [Prolixibacteraceae bacterium]